MNWRNIRTVFRKELIDALRDRRTLISTIVIPTLMFPVLTIGFGTLVGKSLQKVQQERAVVMLLDSGNAPALAEIIRKANGVKLVPAADDYVSQINDKRIRAAIEFPADFEERLKNADNKGLTVKIYHYAGEVRSQAAVQTLQKILREYSDQIVAVRFSEHGLSREIIKPFDSKEENVAAPKRVGGNMIGGLFPYLIIFLCFMGAANPAIDQTAGEKERGTIETLLASAAGRIEVVVGKFLMVFTVSVVTATVSLTSFAATFSLPFLAAKHFSKDGPIPFDISVTGIIAVFFMVLPLAVMFAASLLALGMFARTSKEAHSYIQPLLFIVIMPAMAALLPGFELNAKLAMVPILNVSLVSKEVLTGNYPWGLIALVFGSSCVYGAAALKVTVTTFKRESVLFRS